MDVVYIIGRYTYEVQIINKYGNTMHEILYIDSHNISIYFIYYIYYI